MATNKKNKTAGATFRRWPCIAFDNAFEQFLFVCVAAEFKEYFQRKADIKNLKEAEKRNAGK